MSNDSDIPANNGAVVTIYQIIKAVMYSDAEAKMGALFIKCREAIPERHSLEAMGHKQPPTLMQTDNTNVHGVVTNNIARKHLKYMDMKLHWLRCIIYQKQFSHYWHPGPNNLGDYITKHHASIHHRAVCRTYLTPKHRLVLFRNQKCKNASAARMC